MLNKKKIDKNMIEKVDNSAICEFQYEDLQHLSYNSPHQEDQDSFENYYNEYCYNCKYMQEKCMYWED